MSEINNRKRGSHQLSAHQAAENCAKVIKVNSTGNLQSNKMNPGSGDGDTGKCYDEKTS